MAQPSKDILEALVKDLQSACKSVCDSYNVDFGSLRGWATDDGLMLFNMTTHASSIDEHYARLFREKAELIGLSPEWLNSTVRNPETGRVLQILGLDVDGGEHCVRVESDEKERFNISPSQLTRLIAGA